MNQTNLNKKIDIVILNLLFKTNCKGYYCLSQLFSYYDIKCNLIERINTLKDAQYLRTYDTSYYITCLGKDLVKSTPMDLEGLGVKNLTRFNELLKCNSEQD